MKANPAINYSNFSILLAKSTKFATTTLLSTTFRQPATGAAPLSGFQTAVTSWGAWHPVVQKVGADNSSVGITTTCYSDHMSPEETGQFQHARSQLPVPAPLLMSFIWQKFSRACENKITGKTGVTFKHCNNIVWACFGQYKVRHQ